MIDELGLSSKLNKGNTVPNTWNQFKVNKGKGAEGVDILIGHTDFGVFQTFDFLQHKIDRPGHGIEFIAGEDQILGPEQQILLTGFTHRKTPYQGHQGIVHASRGFLPRGLLKVESRFQKVFAEACFPEESDVVFL